MGVRCSAATASQSLIAALIALLTEVNSGLSRVAILPGLTGKVCQIHDYPIQSLAFSYDNQLLASGGSDVTVKLWDVNGKLVRKIIAHTQGTYVRFSRDGRLLLTWGDGRDGDVAVKLWTIDGALLDSLSTERVKDAWFSADGKWILATAQSQNKAWSLDLDQLLHAGCDALRCTWRIRR